MACKDMNTVIADRPVYVRQWPASVAIENLSEALGLVGSNLSFFIDGSYQFQDTVQMMYSCDHTKLSALLKKFTCAARVDGREVKEAEFNAVYSGDLHRVFDTFAFVCQVNYKDFFEQGVPPPEPDQKDPDGEGQEQEDLLMQNMTP